MHVVLMRPAKVIDLPVAMHRVMATDQERTRHATAIDHAVTHRAMATDQEPTRHAMAMRQRGIAPGKGIRPETVSMYLAR